MKTLAMYKRAGVNANDALQYHRVVDLDVDIGADAVDYKCVHYNYMPLTRSSEQLTLVHFPSPLPTYDFQPATPTHSTRPSFVTPYYHLLRVLAALAP